MKKLTSLLLVAIMLFSVLLTSCSQDVAFDYRNNDLTPYVTLADLANKLQVDVGMLDKDVTEDEVNEAIDDLLVSAGAVYKTITEAGTVCEMGDTLGLTYKGVLVSSLKAAGYKEDGTGLTADQIKDLPAFSGGEAKTTTNLQLGSGKYIAGFEEGLVGKKIGDKNIPLALTFPEDYSNKDLKGQSVVFFVNIENKLQQVDPRDLAFDDIIYVTYEAVLDEKDSAYQKDVEDKGLVTKEKVTELITLSKNDQFHSALIVAFNKMASDARLDVEFKFDDERNVVITVTVPSEDDKTEGEGTEESQPEEQDEGGEATGGENNKTEDDKTEGDKNEDVTKKDVQVTIHYTVTVHKLCNTRYFTHTEAAAGTELKWEDFCKKVKISQEDYKDYATYKAELTEDMQLKRDIQIATDRRKGAFKALVAKSKVDLSAETMREQVLAYFNEVKENIDYMEIQVQTDNNLYSNYYMYTLYYGKISVRNYVLQSYGYSEKDLDITNKSSKLMTDAEEYVTERLVFWQYVKENKIELTDEDYHKGYEEYKKFYQFDASEHEGHDHDAEDLLGHLGITEEQLREALLWDKVADHIAENHCDLNRVPVKED